MLDLFDSYTYSAKALYSRSLALQVPPARSQTALCETP